MKQVFTVVKSTKTEMGNFLTKLTRQKHHEVFGDMGKETFYAFGTNELAKDKRVELNMADFKVIKKDYTFNDEETGEEKTVPLNYLLPA